MGVALHMSDTVAVPHEVRCVVDMASNMWCLPVAVDGEEGAAPHQTEQVPLALSAPNA